MISYKYRVELKQNKNSGQMTYLRPCKLGMLSWQLSLGKVHQDHLHLQEFL
jgi:hypothetical protein